MRRLLLAIAVLVGAVVVIAGVGALLPKGHVATRSARFRQAPEAIWAVLADRAGAPSWRPDVRSVEVLPPRDGRAVWRETWKDGDQILFEETEAVPPRRMVTRIADPNLPFGGRWIIEISPADGGSTVRITEDGEVYNPIFRFLTRFVFGPTGTIEAFLKALRRKFGEETAILDY